MTKKQHGRALAPAGEHALTVHSAQIAQRALDLARSLDQAEHQARVLRFPEDRAVGWLCAVEEEELQIIFGINLAPFAATCREAKGTVTMSVPTGAGIYLEVYPEECVDLAWLAYLGPSDIQTLDFHGTAITDAALVHLRSVSGLLYLSLRNTGVTDSGLIHLRTLNELTQLDLSSTAVSSAGLTVLQNLTGLVTLNLSDTGVTGAGVRRLRMALPHCDILHR